MGDPKLARPGDPVVYRVREATYKRVEIDIQETSTRVFDVTPEAARMAIEVSRNEHAIPAEEATKQARETTRQALARRAVELVVLLFGVWKMASTPDAAVAIGSMIAAVLGSIEGFAALSRYIETRKKLPKNPRG